MNAERMTGQRMTVLFFCFCSGCCSLVYQVLWIRLFSLSLGSTLLSVSFVTAMFFLGLALGSRLGGRLAAENDAPLSLYGRLELILAALAFLVPHVHAWIGGLSSPGLSWTFAGAAMLAPAVPMGCVLPVLTPYVRPAGGRGLAWMYGVNTLGAFAGSLLAGAFGIRFLGVMVTHHLAVCVNVLLGLAVLALAPRLAAPSAPPAEQDGPVPGRLYAAAFLSGLVFMGWEACVMRIFGLYFRDTALLYSGVVAVLILASGTADIVFGAVFGRRRVPVVFILSTLLAWLVAVLCVAGMPFFYQDVVRLGAHPVFLLLIVFVVAGVPAFLFSASMPAFFTVLCRSRKTSLGAGRLFACNTLGSVSGVLLFPLLLFPRAGLTLSLAFLSAVLTLYLGTAAGLWQSAPCARRSTAAACACALLFVVCAPLLPDMTRAALEAKLRGELGAWASLARILEIREGLYGDSWVAELPGGERFLFSDRVIISRDRSASFRTEGFVPLMTGRNVPQRVLSLCFGGGLSTNAAGMLPQVSRFDMVDISRDNMELALDHFADNARWKKDPRAVFHVEDAFRFLDRSDGKWDLILAEPTPPYFGYRGAVFYTTDFFRRAAEHLSDGGVFSMPLPCGQMTPAQARSVMKSFAAVFPHCQLWWNGVDPVMLGGPAPRPLSSAHWESMRNVPGFFRELARVSGPAALQTRESLAAALLMTDADFRAFAREGDVHDLDRPFLEFEGGQEQSFRSAVEIFGHLSNADAVRRCADPDFLPDGYWDSGFALSRTRLINTSVRMAGVM